MSRKRGLFFLFTKRGEDMDQEDWFHPEEYEPAGIVCAGCETKLTHDNVLRVDVTDEFKGRLPKNVDVYVLQCVNCTINNVKIK